MYQLRFQEECFSSNCCSVKPVRGNEEWHLCWLRSLCPNCIRYWHPFVQRETSLPNADPPADSATTSLVNDQIPYMVKTYAKPPPMFVRGEGCYLWDVENRKYLDFTAGIAVNALGHCDPEMNRILNQQVWNHKRCIAYPKLTIYLAVKTPCSYI